MPKDNYVQPTYGDNTKPGGGRAYLDKVDPRRVDDFSEKWKKLEEERKKQGQGSSKGYKQ